MKHHTKAFGLAVLTLVALDTVSATDLRNRWILAIYSAVVLTLTALCWRKPVTIALRRYLIGMLAVSVAVALSVGFFADQDRVYAVLPGLLPTLTGWCVLLALLVGYRDEAGSDLDALLPSRGKLLAALAVYFVLLAVVHQLAVGRLALIADEVMYLTQSRWIRPGQWVPTMPSDIATFFTMRQIDYQNGHLVGQYPMGWPLILAGFRMIGLEWWSNIIVGTLTVWLTYMLGKRTSGRPVGVIAALLLSTSVFFVVLQAGYMAHGITMVGVLGAALCLDAGRERTGARRGLWWAGAGVLMGVAVAARPLSGLTMCAAVGLWMLLKVLPSDRKAGVAMASFVALGGLAPAALFMAYNVRVNGAPLTTGYDAIHHGLYRLGFGTHGYMVLDSLANRVPFTLQFTPLDAVGQTIGRMVSMNIEFFPIGLLAPLIAVALAAGYRIRWRTVALFLILPLAHFFYRYPSIRLYAELLPFLFLSAAGMLVSTYRRWPRIATGMFGMMIASQVLAAIPTRSDRWEAPRPMAESDYGPESPARRAALLTADSLGTAHGKVLLFSREATRWDNLMDRLYIFNGADFNGPVLVVRDLGKRNQELMRRYPDRVPFLVEDRNGDLPAVFTRLAPEP